MIMRTNNWQLCSKKAPPQYTRIEIKDYKNKRYIGYRYGNKYYETFGNYVIKNPYKWRYIPQDSWIWEEVKHRIKNPGNMEVAYIDNL